MAKLGRRRRRVAELELENAELKTRVAELLAEKDKPPVRKAVPAKKN